MQYLGVGIPLPARSSGRLPSGTGMTSQGIFIFRLRLHRERKRISIAEMAATTRLKPEFLEALERNDLSKWPRGLYARAWVRSYATIVGLDPTDTVDEFCRLFPHGDRRNRETFREMAAIIAQPSEYRDEYREADRRRGTPHTDRPAAPSFGSAIAHGADAVCTAVAALVQSPALRRGAGLYGVASR